MQVARPQRLRRGSGFRCVVLFGGFRALPADAFPEVALCVAPASDAVAARLRNLAAPGRAARPRRDLDAVSRGEFQLDAGEVSLHGGEGDVRRGGDLGVATAQGYQLDDLCLAFGEGLARCRCGRGRFGCVRGRAVTCLSRRKVGTGSGPRRVAPPGGKIPTWPKTGFSPSVTPPVDLLELPQRNGEEGASPAHQQVEGVRRACHRDVRSSAASM